MEKHFQSGFITIIGKPNVGKSTLMYAMIGEKVAIVSNRPQTTRNRILGVVTHENDQMIFVDTPGVHQPKTLLGEYMMKTVRDSMDGMDCALLIADASHITDKDMEVLGEVCKKKVPMVLALNKIDLIRPEDVLAATANFSGMPVDDIVPVSARTKEGLDTLEKCLRKHLPEGPRYFPEDMMTDQPERLLCAEIIREKALRNLRDEVPHGIGVEMMSFARMSDDLMEVNATIYCEKESHKGIIIGKQGSMLKTIGSEARHDIEKLMDMHVNLKLWVKVRTDWRNRASELNNLGYGSKQ